MLNILKNKRKKAPKLIVNPLANKKMLIKPKLVTKSSDGDSSDGSSGDSQKNDSQAESDLVEQKKQQQYEQARTRILESSQKEEEIIKPTEIVQPEKPKREKKSLKYNHANDPDYDRSPFAFMSNTLLAPNSTPFYPSNYGYGYPQNP